MVFRLRRGCLGILDTISNSSWLNNREKEGRRRTVFLEQTWLVGRDASSSMLLNPEVSPVRRGSPCIWVEVESSEIKILNLQVLNEIHTLCLSEWISAISTTIHEAFISKGDHVARVKRLDISRDSSCPVINNIRAASWAAHLIRQFPSKDGLRPLISVDNGLDVGLKLRLDLRIGIPICLCGDAGPVVVHCHSTVIVPIIDKWNNQLNSMVLRRLDYIVEALEAVGSSVDYCGLSGNERLEPRLVGRGSLDVVESPDSEDFQA